MTDINIHLFVFRHNGMNKMFAGILEVKCILMKTDTWKNQNINFIICEPKRTFI